jgi:hypothetical protein
MKTILLCIFACLIFFSTSHLSAYTTEDCIRCHQTGSGESALQVDTNEFNRSVHAGEVACQDCHTNVSSKEHMVIKGSGTVDCGECHEQENKHGMGTGSGTRPQCYSCHTRHGILKGDHQGSSVHPEHLKETCGACHPTQVGEAGFLQWLTSLKVKSHGKQDLACNYDKRDCLGCHQGQAAHGEETALNDRSCPKCHFPADDRASLMGAIHPPTESGFNWTGFAKGLYGLAAILLIWGGFRFYIRRLTRKSPDRKRK